MKDKVLVIDGLNYVYRGVLSFGSPKEGADLSVVYNFFRNLRATIEQFEPTKCFILLEGNPIFRKELFPEYKANRIIKEGSKAADKKKSILAQADIIFELLKHLPISQVFAEKYEADDTIATLVHDLQDEEVVIISSDSDLIQILQRYPDKDIKLFDYKTKSFIVPPVYSYLVWKCIAGDSGDNIPSISPKQAVPCAENPEFLKEFLASEENRANFSLNQKLIDLAMVPGNELIFKDYEVSFDKLFEAFEKYEFKSLLKEPYKERFIGTFSELC